MQKKPSKSSFCQTLEDRFESDRARDGSYGREDKMVCFSFIRFSGSVFKSPWFLKRTFWQGEKKAKNIVRIAITRVSPTP
jgi:hypothetical protein